MLSSSRAWPSATRLGAALRGPATAVRSSRGSSPPPAATRAAPPAGSAGAVGAPVLGVHQRVPVELGTVACGRMDPVADRRTTPCAVEDPRLPDRPAAVQPESTDQV